MNRIEEGIVRKMCKVEEIIDNPKIKVCANFLAWYLELENDYGVIDKLARAKSDVDIIDALYAALRVKERLKKLAKDDYNIPPETFEQVIPGGTVLTEIAKFASKCPKTVGVTLATLALSMRPYVKKGVEKGE